MRVVDKCIFCLLPQGPSLVFRCSMGRKVFTLPTRIKKVMYEEHRYWLPRVKLRMWDWERGEMRARSIITSALWEICYKSNGENITPFPLPAALIWLFLFCNRSYFLLNFAVVCVFSEGNCLEQRWQINFSLITVKLTKHTETGQTFYYAYSFFCIFFREKWTNHNEFCS